MKQSRGEVALDIPSEKKIELESVAAGCPSPCFYFFDSLMDSLFFLLQLLLSYFLFALFIVVFFRFISKREILMYCTDKERDGNETFFKWLPTGDPVQAESAIVWHNRLAKSASSIQCRSFSNGSRSADAL